MISKLIALLHVALAAVVLFLTVRVLRNDDNEKQGIVRILIHDQAKRFVPVPDMVGSIATAAMSAASSLATSAVAAGESLIAQTLPSSISIGTKFACIASDCSPIPGSGLRLVESLAEFFPSASQIEELQRIIDKSPNFETALAAGLGLVLVSTALLLASLKFKLLSFVSLGLNVVATILFVALTVFAVLICNVSQAVGDLLGAQTERGGVFEASIGNLVAGVIMCVLALVYSIT
ncbi:hypothetical protein CSUB01_09611 [Colletotrichum sublineola]|uniref:Uncharacterized protein n=1 Tax=Colletotrichum sublineola TaxID=1173701 RepID=A0A066XRM3_COLSU|nr:hypothetical protein CSUB01_09611 [Colletotrichum sublineola]